MNTLVNRLQIKAGKRWLFYNAPAGYFAALEPLPDGVQTLFEIDPATEGIQLFVKNSVELAYALKAVADILKPATILWITYPKKSSGIQSDLDMPHSWDEPKKHGLRPVTSIGIDDTWTAIRLKPEAETKVSEFRSEAVKQNEYAAYIDMETRQVNPPGDMKAVLEDAPQALSFFQSLSFSNKKEYVVWILSAKQEKTRLDRLSKIVEKLLSGKKNPSEK